MKKKVISLLSALALCLAFAVPAFAANYKKGQNVEFSGKADFDYYYTYEADDTAYPFPKTNYKCFSVVADDGQRYYASLKEPQYEYGRTAFGGKDVIFEGKYQETAGDGAPIILIDTEVVLDETGKRFYGNIGDMMWLHANYKNNTDDIFRAFHDTYSDIVTTIADDESYVMIDTNPYDLKNSTAYISTGLSRVEKLNKALGLPDWLYKEIVNTRVIDGRQSETFDKVTVTWSYSQGNGLEVIYRKNN